MRLDVPSLFRSVHACRHAGLVALSLILAIAGCGKQFSKESTKPARVDETDSLFGAKPMIELKFEVPEELIPRLQEDHRPYVRVSMSEKGGRIFERVGMKLKGAAGSYREFGDRPALTIDVNKYKKKQRFYGLEKFSLNNSVQDESYLCEALASEIFSEAGYPAPRVSYARVRLNDRDVGLYVVKEAFDEDFLKRHFGNRSGNLYEGGFVQDIDAALQKDEGEGPDDLSDLRAVTAALKLPPAERRSELEKHVDMPRFMTFSALEKMLVHWDGYTCNANNYRIYFDGQSGRAVFLPHGMDQLFGDTGMPIFDHSPSLLGGELMRHDAWRAAFRSEVKRLSKLFDPDRLSTRIDRLSERVMKQLESIEDADLEAYREHVDDLKARVVERCNNIRGQLEEPEAEPARIDEQGRVVLGDWWTSAESEATRLEKIGQESPETLTLLIDGSRSPRTIAAWYQDLLLKKGSYRLHVNVVTDAIEDLRHEDGNIEAGGVDVIFGPVQPERFKKPQECDLEFDVLEDQRFIRVELRLVTGGSKVEFRNIRIETR